MTILTGDIKFLASKVMDDVPEGGGGPTGTVIPDGTSNAIVGDVTEVARAGGAVHIRQLHLAVQTANTDRLMDANIIVAQPPNDANVSITLAACQPFARRTEIANAIENYLIQGPEWGGYLLENHVAGQRSIQILQRPGTPTPPIGRTLVLVYLEGQAGEVRQYVRVTRVSVEDRTFTYNLNNAYVDYAASVVTCDLTDALRTPFLGSPPSRFYTRESTKTVIRDTTVADAAVYYGATPLSAVASLGDQSARVESIYSQLVPSARTETVALDQRPASVRTLVLATAPRRVEIGAAPHTQRIKIGQENRGFSFTAMLKPLPEPGTLVISFMALGNWYTVVDDGAGAFTGSGSGQIIYGTGSLAITFPSMPDVGSSVIIQWGERVGFTNRSSQGASIRPPEYCFVLEHPGVVPGTVVLTWYSAGVLRTATVNAAGVISGDGTGVVDHPSRTVLLRPSHMPDPGADISVAYDTDEVHTEMLTPGAPDAGGFIPLVLAQQPAAGTLSLEWATARQVSNTSGASQTAATAVKDADVSYVARMQPVNAPEPASVSGSGTAVSWPNATATSGSGSGSSVNWPRSS